MSNVTPDAMPEVMQRRASDDPKTHLHGYLDVARGALLWKLDGLSEYDVRRPMVPTGTNLLGLVKHVAYVEAGYLGDTFGRPFPGIPAWDDVSADPNADMAATTAESREQIRDLSDQVAAHSTATIDALDLEAPGTVPWWPAEHATVTLHRVLVHLIDEVNRHAGHADIVRELIDGAAGLRPANDNLAFGPPGEGAERWATYRSQVQAIADGFR